MAASVIPISSNSSEESVGSHVPRVILFGATPVIILVLPAEVPIVPADPLVAPEVGAVSLTSPARVLDLVDYSSSSDSDPSKDSLPLAPELPLVSPFLCYNDSEADGESEPAEQRPERHESLAVHDVMVSSEAIPFGRPYRTHPNEPLCVDSKGSIEEVVTKTMTEPTLGRYIKEVRADYGLNTTTPSDNEWEESGNTNHPNDNADPFFKPYLDPQEENIICTIKKGGDEHRPKAHDCDVDKSDDISIRNNAP
nr:hypothetical protein [Tanacetum cinerariifolium]